MFSRKHSTSEDASVDNQPYSAEKKVIGGRRLKANGLLKTLWEQLEADLRHQGQASRSSLRIGA